LGPQRIQRRKERFILIKEKQYLEQNEQLSPALKPSFDERFDVDFPRLHSKPRMAKF
jgi:hypothetical protein